MLFNLIAHRFSKRFLKAFNNINEIKRVIKSEAKNKENLQIFTCF